MSHGFYRATADIPTCIDDIFRILATKYASLTNYIDDNAMLLDPRDLVVLLALHARTSTRLARLLRDKHVLAGTQGGPASDELAAAAEEIRQLMEAEGYPPSAEAENIALLHIIHATA